MKYLQFVATIFFKMSSQFHAFPFWFCYKALAVKKYFSTQYLSFIYLFGFQHHTGHITTGS